MPSKDIADRLAFLEKENAELLTFKSFIDDLDLQIYVKDVQKSPEGKYSFPFSYINKIQARKLHIPSPEQAIGKTDADFFGEAAAKKTELDEISVVETQQPFQAEESLELGDNTHYDFLAIKKPRIIDGEVKQILGTSIDITNEVRLRKKIHQKNLELAEANKQLNHMTLHDALTGLPNRKLLKLNAQWALDGAKRSREIPFSVGIIYMDLIFFKYLNDNNPLQHAGGDQALIQVAQRLREIVARKSDTVARVSGDEYVALLTGLKKPEDIQIVIERIRSQINNKPFIIDNEDFALEVSIGYSVFDIDGSEANVAERFEELMAKADKRMNEEKKLRHQELLAQGDERIMR